MRRHAGTAIAVLILLMIACCGSLFASVNPDAVNSKTFPLTSELYDLMDDLYALQGLARPSGSRPWSQSEAELILGRIAYDSLNAPERRIYEAIEDIVYADLRWNFDGFGLGAEIDLAVEMYAHSNDQDFVTDTDWLRGFEKRRPLAKLSLDFSILDYFYTYCDLQYGYGRVTKGDIFYSMEPENGYVTSDGFVGSYYMDHYTNNDGEEVYPHMMVWSGQYSRKFAHSVLPASAYFDFIWPKRSIFSVGGDSWNLQIGRDRLEIGNSVVGNMLVDDHTDFEDYASATFYVSGFKYQWLNLFLNGLTTKGEDRTDDTRIFMIHSLEFRPLPNLSVLISEDVMFRISSSEDGGWESGSQVLDFSFLNPSFIWHNFNNRSMFNAIAYAQIDYAPFKGAQLYGQFVLDQAQAPNEDSSQGDAWGFMLGTSYTKATRKGVAKAYAEFAYTTPLLYRRDKVDFIKCTRYFHFGSIVPTTDPYASDSGSNALVFEFIGFPYGGDCEVLEVGASYESPDLVDVNVFARLYQHGKFTMFTSHSLEKKNSSKPDYDGITPSGDVITRAVYLSSNVKLDMQSLFSWPGVTLEAELDWIGRWKYTKATGEYSDSQTDTQFSLGVCISI